jgi:2-succinyl-5-enolpyruvyl-6-hydroxy-3-cyclohexene-1-carboxylate synthase
MSDSPVVYQPIYDIAELCYRKGIRYVVLCPGSRCAPLTVAFTRHGKFDIRVFSDERSAAFVALGLAQQSKTTVVLICTSGSAVYNFAPAVAEAYFAEVPLLILSADRPQEWIAQHDGQTIFQQGILGRHVKQSYQLPQEYEHPDNQWAINRIINEAINLSQLNQRGPVHINAPFREPLYPSAEEKIKFSKNLRIIDHSSSDMELSEAVRLHFLDHWKKYTKALIVCGQSDHDLALSQLIHFASEKHHVPVIADIISNQHPVEKAIKHADSFLAQAPELLKESLQPSLLITFGKSTISKHLKLFLRKYPPQAHWHIQTGGTVADTFQHLTNVALVSPTTFFNFLSVVDKGEKFEQQVKENYQQLWQVEEEKCVEKTLNFFPQPDLNEFELVSEVLSHLPKRCHVHLSNSMSVRYANFIGLSANQSFVSVYANRGTSGIDGCTSTVVGHCLAETETPNILITGDIAFFYDRNAFWHNYSLPNLRIVLLNNHGGVIFSMIDGPSNLPESEDYFVTRQKLNAKKLCEEYGIEHILLDSRKKTKNLLKDFFEMDSHTKILEIESNTSLNKTIFESFKKKIKERYDS